MKVTDNIADLIFELEQLIGKECYNPNSLNGYTGDEGCSYRYPVYAYPNESSTELQKFRHRINGEYAWYPHVDTEMVSSLNYRFGSNHLYIGKGLTNVLEYIEKRYGIDFDELEEKIRKNAQ